MLFFQYSKPKISKEACCWQTNEVTTFVLILLSSYSLIYIEKIKWHSSVNYVYSLDAAISWLKTQEFAKKKIVWEQIGSLKFTIKSIQHCVLPFFVSVFNIKTCICVCIHVYTYMFMPIRVYQPATRYTLRAYHSA